MEPLSRTAKAIGIFLLSTLLVVTVASMIIAAIDVCMLLFLAILFGVFLTKVSSYIESKTPLNYGFSLAILTFLLLSILAAGISMFGVTIEKKTEEAAEKLDQSLEKLIEDIQSKPLVMSAIRRFPYAEELLDHVHENGITNSKNDTSKKQGNSKRQRDEGRSQKDGPGSNSTIPSEENDQIQSSDEQSENKDQQSDQTKKQQEVSAQSIQATASNTIGFVGKFFSSALGLIATVGVMIFVGIFLASQPALYRDGFAKLFPIEKRPRVVDVMNKMGDALFHWLTGQFFSMLVTGTGTGIVLAILGVPLPVTIGIITGLLTFIPSIGAIMSLGIALLMALTQGPIIALWVLILYVVMQLIESNVVTPLVQQHQVSIPPAYMLSFQILMGAITGFLGIMIATPLLAATKVVINEVWIVDTLGDDSGREHAESD